jgi:hypothetical protein
MTVHLRELEAAGLFRGDPELVGHIYWAALHGPIMLQLSGMLDGRFDAPTLIAALSSAIAKANFSDAGAP